MAFGREIRGRARTIAVASALAAAAVVMFVPSQPARSYPLGPGYWLVASDGGVFSFGDGQFEGSTGNIRLNQPIVGMAAYPFLEGYWMVASDGGVFTFGSAGFHGSTGGIRLNQPIVGMASTPSGEGYWLVAADGGIFAFGDAAFHGSTGSIRLNRPIVGMAATPDGGGYWLVASDGGVFAFGNAAFHGSTGSIRLNRPVVGMAATPNGGGYWLVASDGGIFTFGNAVFHGSTGNIRLNRPIVGMAATPNGGGYWLVASDGGVFSFGNGGFLGSTGGIRLNRPVVGMAARPPLAVAVDPFADGTGRTSTWTTGADEQLRLTWDGVGSSPAGARVLGVEGLTVSQLGTVGFTDETGTCTAAPHVKIYADTNGNGSFDTTATVPCGPARAASELLPGAAVVTSVDVATGAAGTAVVDDIRIAGITVEDHLTHTS